MKRAAHLWVLRLETALALFYMLAAHAYRAPRDGDE